MLGVLRITLMWLIALAVPVQGFAAATMFGCGPGHHGGVGSFPAMADGHAQVADHHSHEAFAKTGVSFDHGHKLDVDDSPEVQGAVHKVTKGNCTPCASCCVVAALPATVIQFDSVPLVDSFVVSAPSCLSSFLSDGLERPPRSCLD